MRVYNFIVIDFFSMAPFLKARAIPLTIVSENGVCFADLVEFRLCRGVVRHVRVELFTQLQDVRLDSTVYFASFRLTLKYFDFISIRDASLVTPSVS